MERSQVNVSAAILWHIQKRKELRGSWKKRGMTEKYRSY